MDKCNRLHEKVRDKTTVLQMDASDIPRLYWNVSWDKVPDSKYKKICLKYVEQMGEMIDKGAGLLLWGKNRSGKSSLAVLILMEGLKRRYDVHFVQADDLVDAAFNHRMVDEDISLYEEVRRTKLLVIDDLGKEGSSKTGSVENVFNNLLRYRHSQCRSTIITTNMTLQAQESNLKTSMMSIIKECMYPVQVELKDYSVWWRKWLNTRLHIE